MQHLVTHISSRFLLSGAFEPSVENLKVQIIIEEIYPFLRTAKLILLSITRALTSNRYYKDMTRTIAEKAAIVTAKISKLVERWEESPQLLDNVAQLEQILLNIHRFVQSDTQWTFHFGEDLPTRYSHFNKSLTALLNNCEQLVASKPDVASEGEALPNSTGQQSSLADTWTLNIASHFSGAHHFVVKGGNYYNISGNYVAVPETNDQECGRILKGIIEGSRVLAVEDVFPDRQIYKGRGYRLYLAQTSGKIVAMKVYEGKNAKERCWEAAEFNQKVIHPNIPHMIGVSPLKSELSFLIFDGECEGTVDYMLDRALKEGLQQSLILGLKTVAGLASGLDYLHPLNYPLASVGLDHFVLLTCKDRVMISFDQEDLGTTNQFDEQLDVSHEAQKAVEVFHGLCQKTFDTARKSHYESQEMQEAFIDEPDNYSDVDDFPDNLLEIDDAADPPGSAESGLPLSNSQAPQRSPRKKLPNGRRQELIWKTQTVETVTLDHISRQFQDFLITHPSSSESALNHRRGRQTTKTAHRCPGYNCIKITLTSDITRSAIIFHSTPSPHEICPVCKEVVKDSDAEIFNCICGDNNESMPTVRCSTCSEWHHQSCVNFFASEDQSSFVCPRCKIVAQSGGTLSKTLSHEDSKSLVQLELVVKQLIGFPNQRKNRKYPRYFLEATVAGTMLPTHPIQSRDGTVLWNKNLLFQDVQPLSTVKIEIYMSPKSGPTKSIAAFEEDLTSLLGSEVPTGISRYISRPFNNTSLRVTFGISVRQETLRSTTAREQVLHEHIEPRPATINISYYDRAGILQSGKLRNT